MLKRYVSPFYPSYSLTVRKNDSIVNVKFANGVFETEDPIVQEAIESNQYFGAAIRELKADEPKQKGAEKRTGVPQHRNNYDPLAEVVFKEKENAKKARKKAKKESK